MTASAFLRLTRPRTLIAAFGPVCLAASFSHAILPAGVDGALALERTLWIFLTVLFAQIAANIWNEFFDFKSGLDIGQPTGNSGTITRDGISPETVKRIGFAFTAAAGIAGLYASYLSTPLFIPIGLFCIAISILYSTGPIPLSRTPFGDLASGLTMGLAVNVLVVYAFTDRFLAEACITGVPSMLLIAAILMTNNIRDIRNDAVHGRKTLAVVLGRNKAIAALRICLFGALLWTIYFVSDETFPVGALASLIAVVPATKAIASLQSSDDVFVGDRAMSFTATAVLTYHLVGGVTMLAGSFI